MTKGLILLVIFLNVAFVGVAQKKNKPKINKSKLASADLPDLCKNLPKLPYNEDSTKVIYIRKFRLENSNKDLNKIFDYNDTQEDSIPSNWQNTGFGIKFEYQKSTNPKYLNGTYSANLFQTPFILNADFLLKIEGDSLKILANNIRIEDKKTKEVQTLEAFRANLFSYKGETLNSACDTVIQINYDMVDLVLNLMTQVMGDE